MVRSIISCDFIVIMIPCIMQIVNFQLIICLNEVTSCNKKCPIIEVVTIGYLGFEGSSPARVIIVPITRVGGI